MSQGGCLTRSGNSKKAQLEQGEGGERQEAWGQITLGLVNGGKFLDFYSKWNKKLVKGFEPRRTWSDSHCRRTSIWWFRKKKENKGSCRESSWEVMWFRGVKSVGAMRTKLLSVLGRWNKQNFWTDWNVVYERNRKHQGWLHVFRL